MSVHQNQWLQTAVHPRRCRCSSSKVLVGLLAALVMISNTNIIRMHHGYLAKYNTIYGYGVPQQTAARSNSKNRELQIVQATQCTPEDLAIIKKQLPPEDCHAYASQPWTQRCSLTYATRCPDNSGWLGKYYTKLHSGSSYARNSNSDTASSSTTKSSPFLGMFIGCNKGLDAIDAFRMGTGNPTFDKSRWKNAITRSGKIQLDTDVCNQASVPQFELPKTNSTQQQTRGSTKVKQSASAAVTVSQLHCIEPMPMTVLNLQRTAYETGYAKKGFIVTHAAMSRHDGFVPFAKLTGGRGKRNEVGIENQGIGNAMNPSECFPGRCMNVSMYSLDTYHRMYQCRYPPSWHSNVSASSIKRGGRTAADLSYIKWHDCLD